METESISYRPLSALFRDTLPDCTENCSDTLCQAIARAAKDSRELFVDLLRHRCPGGRYFVGSDACPLDDVIDVYVKQEQVCATPDITKAFLDTVGRNPRTTRYLHLAPEIRDDADVHILLTNPASASRLIGLCAHFGKLAVDIIPAISTCGVLYRPLLEPDKIHVNFIDYFSRDLQTDMNGNRFYEPNELLLSMTPQMSMRLRGALPKSAHGGIFIPAIHRNQAPPLKEPPFTGPSS